MAFAEDLLEQAQHLARRDRTKPKQASLRRAVSTAYYALFHLLIREAVSNWKRHDQRTTLARAFDHGRMKSASQQVGNRKFEGETAHIVADLKRVAGAFYRLQEFRHLADYDDAAKWSRIDALEAVELASAAFEAWQSIKEEKIAQDYLLQFLVQRR
jgi:uncharacterized protein (UPF0332 family)